LTGTVAKIVPLPKRKTSKQIARSWFDGTLTAEDRKHLGGMAEYIKLAETNNERATTAKRQALKDLSELAELARDEEGQGQVHTVEIVRIKGIEAGVAELA